MIRKNLALAGGNLPQSRIDAQIDVLDDSFSGATGGAVRSPITNCDSCMFEFTPGQAVRMQRAWAAYRA